MTLPDRMKHGTQDLPLPGKSASPFLCAYRGSSMHPTIAEMDLLEITPYDEVPPKAGDAILFVPPGEDLAVIHRITARKKSGFITRGDNCLRNDPWVVGKKNIIGQVTTAYRNNHSRRIAGGVTGLARALSCHMRMRVLSPAWLLPRALARAADRIISFFPFLPTGKRVKVIRFAAGSKCFYKLLYRSRVIGRYDHLSRQWHISFPYRVFLRGRHLPSPTVSLS